MSNIVNFPCRPRAQRRASAQTVIPFSRGQFREIAACLNAVGPTILNEIECNGGSRATEAFLDWVWRESDGRLPEPATGKRGRNSSGAPRR